jgi:hypothetical protein
MVLRESLICPTSSEELTGILFIEKSPLAREPANILTLFKLLAILLRLITITSATRTRQIIVTKRSLVVRILTGSLICDLGISIRSFHPRPGIVVNYTLFTPLFFV